MTPDEFLRLTGKNSVGDLGELPARKGRARHQWTREDGRARNQIEYMREPLLDADDKPLPAGVYYLEADGDLPCRTPGRRASSSCAPT